MAAHQAPPSLGFSRQEHWSGLPFPSPMHESESDVAQSCRTPSDPMNCSLPGSSVHGIFQARVLEWGAIAFSMKRCYIYCFCFFTFQNFPSISASFVEPIIPLKLLIPGLPTISLLIYPNRIFFNLQITKLFLRIYDTCPVSWNALFLGFPDTI